MATTHRGLPACLTPRPGERVVAYQSKTSFQGVFLGFNINDDLVIDSRDGGSFHVSNHLQVRPANPMTRKRPCWAGLKKPTQLRPTTPVQKEQFKSLLDTKIPPGPTYYEFIYEIWARGYEVFLVGGSVRDVLAGDPPHDVDLVTTMPFHLLTPLIEQMFGPDGYSRNPANGFISVGHHVGKHAGDPSIDLKNIFQFAPGTSLARFGADLALDQKLRDFACNAIYFDPVNSIFLDPCGCGFEDVIARRLNLVNDTNMEHPEYRKANINLRYFKFIRRKYTPTPACSDAMQQRIKPTFGSIGNEFIVPEFRRHLLGKEPRERHAEIIEDVKALMFEYRYGDIWDKYLEHRKAQLLGD